MNRINLKHNIFVKTIFMVLLCSQHQNIFSESERNRQSSEKFSLTDLFKPKYSDEYRKVNLDELSNFNDRSSFNNELPVVTSSQVEVISRQPVLASNNFNNSALKTLNDAIRYAVMHHPEILQSIASMASKNASIDVARAAYYPQIDAGVTSGDMTKGERGRQLYSINATQLLYDFGKVKTNVDAQKIRLQSEQINLIVSIDDIASQVAIAIININRYEQLLRIANEQIAGIQYIADIANLRAKAGISSQADPIQAQSYLEAAQSNHIQQQMQLAIYRQRLNILLGIDSKNKQWEISEQLSQQSDLYNDPELNQIPRMMLAQIEIELARLQKEQSKLSRYPTLNVKASLSQALSGKNPNNNEDDGFYKSIMLEATSNFYQGGATSSQIKAATYAEEAAKAKMSATYLDVLDKIRISREQIANKKKQMDVLSQQLSTAKRTKELYQEQYKLGTRSVVDLLNAEQTIHSANSQFETIRFDIYSNLVEYVAATGRSRKVYGLQNIVIQGVEVQS